MEDNHLPDRQVFPARAQTLALAAVDLSYRRSPGSRGLREPARRETGAAQALRAAKRPLEGQTR